VLCNPLGFEALRVHRAYRHLAAWLAGAGFSVLRFDHYGTGDSAGDNREDGTLTAVLDGVAAAIDEVRERSGTAESAVFGVRMGATLAAFAAAARGGVSSAVLWAPCVSGSAYVREMRVIARALRLDPTKETPWEAACLEVSPAAVAELSSLNLMALAARPSLGALLVPRAEATRADEQLIVALRGLGTDARLASIEGYAEMMRDSHESRVPRALIEGTVAWLSERHPTRQAPRRLASVEGARTELAIAGTAGSSGIVEVPVRFGHEDRLFGIVTKLDARPKEGCVGVLLTSVGALHRVGPGRLYVALARRLARLGTPAIRFDLSGIGDSLPADGITENTLYAQGAREDVRAAMDCLARSTGVTRFVLVGVCSGGYAAYVAAVADPRVKTLVAINVPTFRWNEGAPVEAVVARSVRSNGYYWRGLLRSRVWRRLLRGQVNAGAIVRSLGRLWARRAEAWASGVVSTARGRSGASDVASDLLAMCARGTHVTLVYGDDEPGLDEARLHLATSAKLSGHPMFRLAVVSGADHTFTNGEAQLKALLAPHIEAVG
jgi:alpha-beta hydrolase superfamily lysophospholipase